MNANPKTPETFALKMLEKLFEEEELACGILFESTRSRKTALDSNRVAKLFGKYLFH
jgi:hypothetical protein